MAEYIEREAATKLFSFATLDCLGMEPTIRADDVVAALKSIPAADVVARDCYDRLLAENDELRKERPTAHSRWVFDY